jgi:hypothetical protein
MAGPDNSTKRIPLHRKTVEDRQEKPDTKTLVEFYLEQGQTPKAIENWMLRRKTAQRRKKACSGNHPEHHRTQSANSAEYQKLYTESV